MPSLRDLVVQILAVAGSELAVLVIGETGTGKELVARAIHEASPVSKGPFVAANCGAIPLELIESELFGHERGAFTGADRPRRGLWSRADGGTLFLDEFGELPMRAQPVFLRVLETGEYFRVGGEAVEQAKPRIITATNRNLPEMMREGRFHRDLFYRVAQYLIHVPPLRARIATDLDALLDMVLGSKHTLTKAARQRLIEHRWPGNVREFMNVVKAAVVLAGGGVIDARHIVFPEEAWLRAAGDDQRDDHVPEAERATHQRVMKVGEACNWNRAKAANMLGMSQSSLCRLLKRLGLRETWRLRQAAERLLTPPDAE
ncbi:MAG: sigma 54-interacting transcriptional regulator [Thermoanaerobaculia bacterium]|nr:sigma 54-interacting transcriptional regulator [Thermoanaerobaculia bacterium]